MLKAAFVRLLSIKYSTYVFFISFKVVSLYIHTANKHSCTQIKVKTTVSQNSLYIRLSVLKPNMSQLRNEELWLTSIVELNFKECRGFS